MADVRQKIEEAAHACGRTPKDVILLGATKTVAPERIQEAVDAGLMYIGENRVQEFVEKHPHVQGAHWHFIGHLQTNKVKYIIDKAELIHAVDSKKLMDEIERQALKHGICAKVLLEINASGEATKFGTSYDAVLPLIEENERRAHVQIEGLMTIGPHVEEERAIRTAFAQMYKLFDAIGAKQYKNCKMQYLSMGMSGDYPLAIKEGANIVRVGSAIFGHREWR